MKLIFPSPPTFFSLTTDQAKEYRANLFNVIHEIVFHGKGGYDFHTVYDMPIWLRNFTFKRLEQFYKDQNQNTGTHPTGKGSTTSTNDINQATNILKKAQRSDPRSKGSPSPNQITVPDFVTQAKK